MRLLSKAVVFGGDFNAEFIPVTLSRVSYKEQRGGGWQFVCFFNQSLIKLSVKIPIQSLWMQVIL